MKRLVAGYAVVGAALLGFATMAAAHHPPRFERCRSFTLEGSIERVEWANPHVLLSIKADDGTTYSVMWLNVQQLSLEGLEPNTLKAGDRVVFSASRQSRGRDGDVLLRDIRRPADGWGWSQDPQGC